MTGRTQYGPVSLRISITGRCPLRCVYCMPPHGVPERDEHELLRLEDILRFVRLLQQRFGLSKVHITGGDPLVHPGVADLLAMLAREKIADIALTTNGQRLAQMAGALKRAGLRRINISLDTLNEKTYTTLTRGGDLQPVLEGIEAARREGFSPVKLNTVVLRNCNNKEVARLAQWAVERGCCIRFLELMPIACARPMFEDLFVPASEVRARLHRCFDLEPMACEPGESSRYFRASDRCGRRGVIGFISPETQPFCGGCRRLRLTSTGRLISCLRHGQGPTIRNLLRSGAPEADRALREEVERALGEKRSRMAFDTNHLMVTVGG